MNYQVYIIFDERQILIAEFSCFNDAKNFLELKNQTKEAK